jgi:hypothetical protein
MHCTRRKDITLTVDPAGYIFVSGPIHQNPKRWDELFVAKFDPQGKLLWQRDINRKSSLERPYETFSARPTTSAPTVIEEEDDERDSVSPHAVDQELDYLELQLGQRSPISRALGYAAGFAFLVAIGFLSAAGFHQGRMQAAAERVAAARSANLQDTAAVAIDGAHEAMSAALAAEATYAGEPTLASEPVERVAPPMLKHDINDGPIMSAPQSKPVESKPVESKPEAANSSASLLRAETLKLLNTGKAAEAVDAARAYVSVAPESAHSHLCLGAALQSLGRMAEATAAYSACVKQAKSGSVWECRALGGK